MERTKENIALCHKLVRDLGNLRFSDTLTPDFIAKLSDTLLRSAINPAQAAKIVDVWIQEHAEYPTPADLNQIARTMNHETVKLPPPCAHCLATPGYIRIKAIVKDGVFAGESREALALCSCPRGEMLREGAMKYKREESKFEDDTKLEPIE